MSFLCSSDSPALPARRAFSERRCFRTWASRFRDIFLTPTWLRQVSAPAWAASPAPGHLRPGEGCRGRGGGGGGGGGCGSGEETLGTPRPWWPYKAPLLPTLYARRARRLAELQLPVSPSRSLPSPGAWQGSPGLRVHHALVRCPLLRTGPGPLLPISLSCFPLSWGLDSLFQSLGLLTPISSSFSGPEVPLCPLSLPAHA